jgi:hypothetical protein
MRRLFEILRTDEDTGVGLEPLLHEFAYDIADLSDADRKSRIAKITGYYRALYDRSKSLYVAYGKTRDWAKKLFITPYLKKALDNARMSDEPGQNG